MLRDAQLKDVPAKSQLISPDGDLGTVVKGLSKSTLERFASDFRLPIHIFREPYFSYLVGLYEKDFGAQQSFAKFTAAVEAAGGEAPFIAESRRVFHAAVDSIRHSKEFAENLWMNRSDLPEYCRERGLVPQSKFLDAVNNVERARPDRFFLSLDMVSANFQVLRLIGALPFQDYQEFMAQFTKESYYLSKGLRQAIFGQLDTRRQNLIQGIITAELSAVLLPKLADFGVEAKALCVDELAICLQKDPTDYLAELVGSALAELDLSRHGLPCDVALRADAYRLAPVGTRNYLARTRMTRLEFRGSAVTSSWKGEQLSFLKVPKVYFAECYKHYRGLPLVPEMDLAYEEDGRVAIFKTPLFPSESNR